MSNIQIGNYYVPIQNIDGTRQQALLTPASKEDMPPQKRKNSVGWDFFWTDLWDNTDPDFSNIIKLTYRNEIWGLVRYTLDKAPNTNNPNIKILEIEQLEAKQNSRWEQKQRLIAPIGKWLIWYSVRVGLQYGHKSKKNPLILLSSYPDAVDYQKASGKPPTLGVGMNTVVASATREEIDHAKRFYLQYSVINSSHANQGSQATERNQGAIPSS